MWEVSYSLNLFLLTYLLRVKFNSYTFNLLFEKLQNFNSVVFLVYNLYFIVTLCILYDILLYEILY